MTQKLYKIGYKLNHQFMAKLIMMLMKIHFFILVLILSHHIYPFHLVPSLSVHFNSLVYPLDISRCFPPDVRNVPLNI